MYYTTLCNCIVVYRKAVGTHDPDESVRPDFMQGYDLQAD